MHIKEVAHRLMEDFDVAGILCYGSYAQKTHDQKSDIDLLVISSQIPNVMDREKSYLKLSSVKILALDNASIKNPEQWDISWTPVNDRIKIGEEVFDIGFNTTSWVETVINNLIEKHQISFKEFPFRPYTFLGLLESSQIIYEKDGFLKNCKAQIRPMPQELKKKIIQVFFPLLEESAEELKDYSERDIGILAYQFHLFKGMDAAIQLLFAINEVYDPASKRIEPFLLKLEKAPKSLAPFLKAVLPCFYQKKQEVNAFFAEVISLIKKQLLR